MSASASTEPQPLVLQGTARSHRHPVATAVFWSGIGFPQGCGSGRISSEPCPGAPVTCQKRSPEAARGGCEALAWLRCTPMADKPCPRPCLQPHFDVTQLFNYPLRFLQQKPAVGNPLLSRAGEPRCTLHFGDTVFSFLGLAG